MALTIPSGNFGMVASALGNKEQPELKNNRFCSSFRLAPQDGNKKIYTMKKIFTLMLGLMLTAAMFAADRRPTVTVTTAKKFEIVIDGRRYVTNYGNTMSISNLYDGRHNIRVYEMRHGFFMRKKRLVASSSFQLRNNDVQIHVDRFGHLDISQSRFGHDWNDRDRYNDGHDRHDDHRDNHDRRF